MPKTEINSRHPEWPDYSLYSILFYLNGGSSKRNWKKAKLLKLLSILNFQLSKKAKKILYAILNIKLTQEIAASVVECTDTFLNKSLWCGQKITRYIRLIGVITQVYRDMHKQETIKKIYRTHRKYFILRVMCCVFCDTIFIISSDETFTRLDTVTKESYLNKVRGGTD